MDESELLVKAKRLHVVALCMQLDTPDAVGTQPMNRIEQHGLSDPLTLTPRIDRHRAQHDNVPRTTEVAGRLVEAGKLTVDFPHVEAAAAQKILVHGPEILKRHGLVREVGNHRLVRIDGEDLIDVLVFGFS